MQQTQTSGGTASTGGAAGISGIPDFDGASLFNFQDVDLPSGDELYDRIMGGIEPELMSANVGLLKEKYKNETAAEKKARSERYGKAYAEYEKQFSAYQTARDSAVVRHKSVALQSLEESHKQAEQVGLSDLESQILSM